MKHPISAESGLRRHVAALAAPLHDDLIISQTETEAYFGLTTTGKRIWDLLSSAMTAGALCDILAGEFGVEPSEIEPDVFSFLTDLEQEGLIVIEE